MPKRAATPPPADDTQYFTVVNPYPQLPQLGTEDSKTVARWIACIIGQENLYAFYHKPNSPNVVIIEVPKDGFLDLRLLLGEHRWSEFLKAPSEKSASEVSKIFPCKMTTQRSIEKVMWLRRDVQSSWFRNWNPERDSNVVYPYPLPRFCTPPLDKDISRNPLCRPLPASLFHNDASSTNRPILAPFARPAAITTAATSAYPNRSTPVFTPLSEPFDDSESQSEDWVPMPAILTPPGLAPRFVPAIHGADIPKGDCVVEGSSAVPSEDVETLWAGYGETDAPLDPELCEVHGVMCSRGVCRARARRKRQEEMEKRMKRMQEEKEARNKRRERERGRDKDRERRSAHSGSDVGSDSASASDASSEASSRAGSASPERDTAVERLRDDIPLTTVKGKFIRASSSPGARGPATNPEPRALPPHLRKGASKLVGAVSSAPPLVSTPTASTHIPSAVSPIPSGTIDTDVRSVSPAKPSKSLDVEQLNISGLELSPDRLAKKPSAKVSIRSHIGASNDSTMTAAVFQGSSKQAQPVQSARARWADMVDEDELGTQSEDENADEDEEDVGLPRGVTVIPVMRVREEDTESVTSAWSDAEPF
ncbi:hypothetical protein BD311DRAFT_847178 [Dichomitus squalens]|uniref:Uncharacterized protein n=1 Tax=Dichomitus squalens TaxID=114155 RepID=A0A4Q9MH08_9APHY|nr:hypothetical protein BD311DRAFT_847178 [Dichomitus squalens]